MIVLSTIVILILTLIISFLGSVQLGPVNITVIRYAVSHQFKTALYIGLGGALPELIYSAISIKGADFLAQFPNMLTYLFWISIPLFFVIGLYFIFNAKLRIKQKDLEAEPSIIKSKEIIKSITLGFSIGIINPMLLPFWIIVLNTYHVYGLMMNSSSLEILAFIIGTGLGAFLLQYALVYLIKKYKQRFEQFILKYSNPITGWMFILLALIQLIQFMNT